MNKLPRILLLTLLVLALVLAPLTAQAAEGYTLTYNCNYILQLLRDNLCRYLYQNGCYEEYDPNSPLPQLSEDEPTPDLNYYIPQTGRQVELKVPDSEDKLKVSVSGLAQEVVDLINEERAAAGLDPVKLDAALCDGAAIRVTEINSKFSHTRPNGENCFTALDEANVEYIRAGENIAIGQRTAAEVMEDWMNSPSHKANILNSRYSRVGVAVTNSTDPRYGGYAWVQEFAN